jgi:hypothetical protein
MDHISIRSIRENINTTKERNKEAVLDVNTEAGLGDKHRQH